MHLGTDYNCTDCQDCSGAIFYTTEWESPDYSVGLSGGAVVSHIDLANFQDFGIVTIVADPVNGFDPCLCIRTDAEWEAWERKLAEELTEAASEPPGY